MSSDPTLVVMAAGVGSRYGGLKQIDPVGPSGEIILDYSAYDAIRAGFGKIVFVIRPDIEEAFREKVGRSIERKIDVAYVFQLLEDIPAGLTVPEGRTKPWGTGHAVMSARDAIPTPFAVINADDFYGAAAYEALAKYLRQARDRDGVLDLCMVGYEVGNTLSEHGSVARGVCELTRDGYLAGVCERTRVERRPEGIAFSEDGENWTTLSPDTIVSLNTWGFTTSMLAELAARFGDFYERSTDNILKAEYFLPEVVGELISEHKATVKVLPVKERWFGVTYQADRPIVQAAIRDLIASGAYPDDLWGKGI